MAPRNAIRRTLGCLAGVLLTVGLGGCGSSNKVSFTNVSDTWLNVSYYVKDTAPPMPDTGTGEQTGTGEATVTEVTPATGDAQPFVARDRLQVKPGESTTYQLTKIPGYKRGTDQVVHVQVQPVNPSWQRTGREYWLELLTQPPMTIVATGTAEQISFISRDGALAIIPEDQVEGRFEHRMVTATEEPAK